MFEQSFYSTDIPAEPTRPGEFLHNYELRNWNFSPRIYKIIAASAIFNILAILIVGQTSLLTMKGCESPLVGRVCQVLDTVYVGSMLFGTDREYVDAIYDKTDLQDAEITYIDVSNVTPPLSYPEGYFQLANPVQYAMLQQQAANPAPFDTSSFQGLTTSPSTSGDLRNKPAQTPTPNPDVVEGPLPTIGDSGGDPAQRPASRARGNRKNPRGEPNKQPGNTETAAEPTPTANPTDPVAGIEKFNTRPYKDLGRMVIDLLGKNLLQLDADFILRARGRLNDNARLDPKTFDWIEVKSSNKEMVEVLKRSIEAISESGQLQYLKALSGKDLDLDIRQDNVNLTAVVQSELENDNRAKSIASGLQVFIAGAKYKKEKGIREMEIANDPNKARELQDDKDDLELLNRVQVTSEGKRLVIKFLVPQDVAQKMIERKLAEQQAEIQKSNGTSLTKPNDNTAKK